VKPTRTFFSLEMMAWAFPYDAATYHRLVIAIDRKAFAERDVDAIKAAFDAVHSQRYGYASSDESAEIVNLRLSVIGVIAKPGHAPLAAAKSASADDALIGVRAVEFGVMGGRLETPLYDRARLLRGHRVVGPALIQEYASTTVLLPGDSLVVDGMGNLDITIEVRP
jgi:N-methylhydantoinase A